MRPVGYGPDLPVPNPSEYIHGDITGASGDVDKIGNCDFDCKEILQYKPFTKSDLMIWLQIWV